MRLATAVLGALITLMLAGCGGDEDSATTEETPSPEQRIKQIGNKWTPLLTLCPGAEDQANRQQMGTALRCWPLRCGLQVSDPSPSASGPPANTRAGRRDRPQPTPNCTPPSSAFRKSFEDATVQDVAIEGGRAGARLSNGELVEFVGVRPVRCIGSACPRPTPKAWLIHKLGGNAEQRKYFGS